MTPNERSRPSQGVPTLPECLLTELISSEVPAELEGPRPARVASRAPPAGQRRRRQG